MDTPVSIQICLSRGFCITVLLFTTFMTTCTFLERYFDREAYSVIKKSGNEIKCWPKSPSKWLAARTSLCIFDQAASFERGFCNIFKYTRVLFLLLCLPKALRYHLTVYKHVCMVGNASISANRRICGFTHFQVCCHWVKGPSSGSALLEITFPQVFCLTLSWGRDARFQRWSPFALFVINFQKQVT